jgi:NAD+ synthase (glutamine-hydrolysing)
MPSRYSSQHSKDDALSLHQQLGCWDYLVPIDHIDVVAMLNNRYSQHGDREENLVTKKLANGLYNSVADENIQARMRDLYIMHFSNAFGAMPLSTGNKTESACGYYTHFDMSFSFAPIKDLYKFEVVKLARQEQRIPSNIWQKPPSAELAVGQVDEDSLLPYAILDPIVKAYIEDYVSTFEGFEKWLPEQPKWLEISSDQNLLQQWLSTATASQDHQKITKLIGLMEYKRRQTCPGTKVSRVAFGIGRRIPIVEKWS